MNWLRTHRRSAVIIAATLLLPAWVYGWALLSLLSLRAEHAERIADLRPRVARLAGLLGNEAALRDAAAAVDDRLAALGFGPGQDATAAAASLQSEVRRVLGDAGLRITNSQVLATRREDPFDLVGVKVTVAGGLQALDSALAGLAAFRPLLLVGSLDIFPLRARGRDRGDGVQEVTAVMELIALRRDP